MFCNSRSTRSLLNCQKELEGETVLTQTKALKEVGFQNRKTQKPPDHSKQPNNNFSLSWVALTFVLMAARAVGTPRPFPAKSTCREMFTRDFQFSTFVPEFLSRVYLRDGLDCRVMHFLSVEICHDHLLSSITVNALTRRNIERISHYA